MVSNFSPSTDRPAAVAVVLPANQFGNSGRGRCENAAALPIAGTLDSLTHLVFVSAAGRVDWRDASQNHVGSAPIDAKWTDLHLVVEIGRAHV